MIVKQHVKVQGQFKFDVYDKSGRLKSSTDYFDNFITPTGLLIYPTILPFADCFRYISIGEGTDSNTINGVGTTGLSSPLPQFAYIGGDLSDVGGQNQYELNGCGFIEGASGVSLQRAWKIPTGDIFFDTDYTFNEFMLSPGKPLDSNSNCNELADLLGVYPNICSLTKAFARVIKPVSVSMDDYMIAYYSLNITTNTGVTFYNILSDNAGIALGTDSNNWNGHITGVSSIVHHGLKLVRGESVISVPYYVDQSYTSQHFGDSFNGPLGSPLEPSTPSIEYVVYLSSDDTQFLVSEISGAGMDTGLYFPYNITGKPFPSGVEYFHAQPYFETAGGKNIPYWLKNIRMGGGAYFPCANNFSADCNETNIGLTLNTIQASSTTNSSFSTFRVSDRTRSRSISVEFAGINAGSFTDYPARSLVMGYRSSDGSNNIFPFYDSLFASNTEGILPSINTGIGVMNYSVPSDGYSYLDGINNLTLQFQLSWSSPCSPDVDGC